MPEAAQMGSLPLTDADHAWLARAKGLASSGWGRVHPNPMVGCVIVKDGTIVGEGWHEEFGGPHAEVNALAAAGDGAEGATAYISLEPCSHHGKTPPCSDALLMAGVSAVIFAAPDPGPRTDAGSGGGAQRLSAAGVRVEGPVYALDEARRDNPAFFHQLEHDAPYLALKLAVSSDGCVAAAEGKQTAISGPEADEWVHRLRAGFDAIMVGAGTARVDDPLLTVRGAVTPRQAPVRIVVDPAASISRHAKLFDTPLAAPVLVFVTDRAPSENLAALQDAGAEVVAVNKARGGCSLTEVFDACWARGLGSILCEGGPRLAESLTTAGLAQRLYLLTAPRPVGASGVPMRVDPASGWHAITEAAHLGVDQLLILERGS